MLSADRGIHSSTHDGPRSRTGTVSQFNAKMATAVPEDEETDNPVAEVGMQEGVRIGSGRHRRRSCVVTGSEQALGDEDAPSAGNGLDSLGSVPRGGEGTPGSGSSLVRSKNRRASVGAYNSSEAAAFSRYSSRRPGSSVSILARSPLARAKMDDDLKILAWKASLMRRSSISRFIVDQQMTNASFVA